MQQIKIHVASKGVGYDEQYDDGREVLSFIELF